MLQVFTKDWIQELRTQFERLPVSKRPVIYSIATADAYHSLRMAIEEMVCKLPPDKRNDVVGKFQTEEHFWNMFYTLTVGEMLAQKGYEVEYDKDFDGLNPDWYVASKETTPAFVVEVFTDIASSSQQHRSYLIRDLTMRIKRIPSGLTLMMHIEPTVQLSEQDNKQIFEAIKNWIMDHHPRPRLRARHGVSGIRIQVLNHSVTRQTTEVVPFTNAFFVDTEALKRKIKSKVKKYKHICAQRQLPLVICAFAGFGTARSLYSLEAILFGNEVAQLVSNNDSGDILPRVLTRANDGLFHEKPELSAVIWMEGNGMGGWTVTIMSNPSATFHISEDALAPRHADGN
jgi:hypothetical protein